jgi:hypothetical protein
MIRKSNPSTQKEKERKRKSCLHAHTWHIYKNTIRDLFLSSSSERNTPQQLNNTPRERHPELMVRETRPALGNVHVHKSLIKGRIVASEKKKKIRKT